MLNEYGKFSFFFKRQALFDGLDRRVPGGGGGGGGSTLFRPGAASIMACMQCYPPPPPPKEVLRTPLGLEVQVFRFYFLCTCISLTLIPCSDMEPRVLKWKQF